MALLVWIHSSHFRNLTPDEIDSLEIELSSSRFECFQKQQARLKIIGVLRRYYYGILPHLFHIICDS